MKEKQIVDIFNSIYDYDLISYTDFLYIVTPMKSLELDKFEDAVITCLDTGNIEALSYLLVSYM